MVRNFLSALLLASAAVGLVGCSSDVSDEGEDALASALSVEQGPVDVPGSSTEVWKVTRNWTDRTPAGITYEADFIQWVQGLERTQATRYGETLKITTPAGAPYQRTLASPTLECADTALFLRVAYASLNKLPFYMRDGDLYAGHFGIIKKDGSRHEMGNSYKTAFRDFESSWSEGQPWPSDGKLRGRHAGYSSGDETFVEVRPGTKGGNGAWFDEFFLNKRVGYFLLNLVDIFGSMNLADEANLFHVKPEATLPGDALVHRHGKYKPIGHTLLVYQVRKSEGPHMEIEIVSGSMPARQATWEPFYQARSYFVSEEGGGNKVEPECRSGYSIAYNDTAEPKRCVKEIDSIDRVEGAACAAPYVAHSYDQTKCVRNEYIPSVQTNLATLGGGIRRFRTPVLSGGRWNNIVPQNAADVYLPPRDIEAIGARPKQFEELISLGTPESRIKAAQLSIASAREYIRTAPSTCSARSKREAAFADLYAAHREAGNYDNAKIDKENRTLEDYVFAELDYDTSKTCCWNSTKPEHFQTIMAFTDDVMKKAEAEGKCIAPPVFQATPGGDGYAAVRAFAAARSLPFPAAWTEDEPCKAKDVQQDSLSRRAQGLEAYCDANAPEPASEPMGPQQEP